MQVMLWRCAVAEDKIVNRQGRSRSWCAVAPPGRNLHTACTLLPSALTGSASHAQVQPTDGRAHVSPDRAYYYAACTCERFALPPAVGTVERRPQPGVWQCWRAERQLPQARGRASRPAPTPPSSDGLEDQVARRLPRSALPRYRAQGAQFALCACVQVRGRRGAPAQGAASAGGRARPGRTPPPWLPSGRVAVPAYGRAARCGCGRAADTHGGPVRVILWWCLPGRDRERAGALSSDAWPSAVPRRRDLREDQTRD